MATLTHRSGAITPYTDSLDIQALVAELDGAGDTEHPDVAVVHPSGWALSAFQDGLLVWENVEGDGEASHRSSVSREEVARLFERLVAGDLDGVAAVGWQPGYGS